MCSCRRTADLARQASVKEERAREAEEVGRLREQVQPPLPPPPHACKWQRYARPREACSVPGPTLVQRHLHGWPCARICSPRVS